MLADAGHSACVRLYIQFTSREQILGSKAQSLGTSRGPLRCIQGAERNQAGLGLNSGNVVCMRKAWH